ncbi:hypothetical protein Ndes2526B_g05544 [Nannochloris sp. 'desiccata']|nr:hypothetical protein KSW81_007407 [Chlorella desiccata (nom. nud.)]KAH7618633.1 hypothetical protein NADE_005482 [Chlorella desiccata (nom. nud.)]
MAKSIRSKVKRVFRTSKRTAITVSPWQVAAEKKKQEALQAILDAPKPEHPEQPDAPAKMDQDIKDDLPEVTAQNSGSILKKLKARRLAAARGAVPGKQKKRNPLAGANQFHKKKKKRSNK